MAISLHEGSFSALIFDCDGTLVDTAPAHLRALQQALEPLTLTMTPAWYYPRAGLTPDALMDEYETQLSAPPPSRQVIFERYNVAFQAGLHLIEEINVIAEIARDWRGRVPMAVASNGRRRNVEATLRVTKLLPLFDCIVAAEDVVHGKPEPDVFLEAARCMKVDPDRCVVFEDSNEGLEAAHRAGMRGIDIRAFYSPQRSM
jgi:beta-phosphoglucomutase-like phosphatase (HAD superfamily)